jgi:hypothetical protein
MDLSRFYLFILLHFNLFLFSAHQLFDIGTRLR